MPILQICSVYDVKAESYGLPFGVVALGVASRDFVDACSKEDSPLSRHRSDYDLYHLGTLDQSSGQIVAVVPPKLVLRGSEAL